MAHLYVYAPCTGSNWGQGTYCYDGSSHTTVWSLGGGSPMDISGGTGTPIYFWGNSQVKSIRSTRVSGVCASDPAPWDHGVKVEIYTGYNATGTLVGTVGYGHLRTRIADGVHNGTAFQVGKLPYDCACGCSSGVHVHMQASGATQNSLSCYTTVYQGSTWIYRWTV